MKSKEFILDNQTTFTVTKRSTNRHMRLSISPNGEIKVSIPTYIPYSAAITFVKSRIKWIEKHKPQIKLLTNGMPIGKSHHIYFETYLSKDDQIKTRIKDTDIIVSYPSSVDIGSNSVQQAAKRSVAKALRIQAQSLLPIRTANLAEKYGFKYSDIKFRNLKNRWGSCDNQKNLTFNIYLLELPWELIDYVVIHELNHTKYLNHSQDFWNNMSKMLPNVKDLRKQIKEYKARI